MQEVAWLHAVGAILHILLHLSALILGAVFWRRHPKVCFLVLVGGMLNLSALLVRMALPQLWPTLFDNRIDFAAVNLGLSLLSICGSLLYLIAAFTGRREPGYPRHRLPPEADDWHSPAPPTRQPARGEAGDTGIEEHD